ncbi:MAG: hypothetical protein ACXW3Z_12190 [Limisphaerales bacterium]
MRLVITLSIVLGLLWNFAAVALMGGRLADAFAPAWLLAASSFNCLSRYIIWHTYLRTSA